MHTLIFPAFLVATAFLSTPAGAQSQDSLSERFELATEAVLLNDPKSILLNSNHALKQHPLFNDIIAKVDFSAVRTQAAEMMALDFTVEELKAMLAFQQSPVGKSIAAKMPRYQRVVGAIIQGSMQESFKEIMLERGIKPGDMQGLQNLPGQNQNANPASRGIPRPSYPNPTNPTGSGLGSGLGSTLGSPVR